MFFAFRLFDQNRHIKTAIASNATPPMTPPATTSAGIFCWGDEVSVAVALGAVNDDVELAKLPMVAGPSSKTVVALGAVNELTKLPMVAGPSSKTAVGVLQQRVPSPSDSQQ